MSGNLYIYNANKKLDSTFFNSKFCLRRRSKDFSNILRVIQLGLLETLLGLGRATSGTYIRICTSGIGHKRSIHEKAMLCNKNGAIIVDKIKN